MHRYHHHHHHDHDCRDEGYHFMGRHRHGARGFGRFMGDGFGSQDFRTGRKLASGDLQLLVLALLAEKPRHGYEIIKALEERSSGFYAPSPGMVYPALTYLEEIGHATVVVEGAKKCYHITDEGRAYLAQHRAAVDAILSQLEQIGRKMEHVRRVFSGEQAAADDEESESSGFGLGGYKGVWLARRELKAALHDKKFSGPDELKRVAEILRRAAQEIRRK
ncbi:MAG: PadR family transcriptional regulator [Nevskia sp.]|nr:PadR family transcriptional regulator [Nevskia sp.]